MVHRQSLWSSIAVLLCTLAICIGAGEIILRVIDYGHRSAAKVRTNAPGGGRGFRVPLPQQEKPADEFRILCLGDSYTWGDGIIDPSDTWPSQLEHNLGMTSDGKRISVVNLGICGLTTVNEYELLARVGLNMRPDLVIVGFVINDVLPSGPNLRRVGESWLAVHKRYNLILNSGWHDRCTRYSYLYTFLNDRVLALQRKIWPNKTWHDLYADDFPGWAACRKALTAMGHVSREKGFKTIFVCFPHFQSGIWTVERYPERSLYVKAMAAAQAAGLTVVDLLPVFVEQGKDFRSWRVSAVDGHPNERAHRLVAGVVSQILKERGLIP